MIVLCAGPLVFVKYPCVERETNVSAALFLPLDAKSRIYLTQLNKKKKGSVFPPSLKYLLKGWKINARVAEGCMIIYTLKVPIGPVSDFYLYPRLQS